MAKGDKFISYYGKKTHIEGGDGFSLCFRVHRRVFRRQEVKPDSPKCIDCFRMAGESGLIYVKPKLTKWEPLINLKHSKGKLFYDTARLMRWNQGVQTK